MDGGDFDEFYIATLYELNTSGLTPIKLTENQ